MVWRGLRPALARILAIFSAISWLDREAGFDGRVFSRIFNSFCVDILCGIVKKRALSLVTQRVG